jgi:tryptophan synthase alpha chain
MTYVTVADTRGYARFADDCAAVGLDGVILPDLPVTDADVWRAACAEKGLASVFLASSVSTDERIDAITAASKGWVYAIGRLGVTGVNGVDDGPTRILDAATGAQDRLGHQGDGLVLADDTLVQHVLQPEQLVLLARDEAGDGHAAG